MAESLVYSKAFIVLISCLLFICAVASILRYDSVQRVVRFVDKIDHYHFPLLKPPKRKVFGEAVQLWTNNIAKDYKLDSIKHFLDKDSYEYESLTQEAQDMKKYASLIKNMTLSEHLHFEQYSQGIVVNYYSKVGILALTHILYHLFAFERSVPIEIWCEREDFPEEMSTLIKGLGNKTVTLRYYDEVRDVITRLVGELDRPKHWKPFHYKLWAMLGSRFQHVLFMDTDAFLLVPPDEFLEKLKRLNKAGVFWHDLYGMERRNPIFSQLGIPPLRGQSGESGVVYVNKNIGWDALCVATRMNHRQRVFYKLLHGDKDTFFLSFELAHRDYFWVPYSPGRVGKGNDTLHFSGHAFFQPSPDGYPGFVHFVVNKNYVVENLMNKTRIMEQAFTFNAGEGYTTRTVNGQKGIIPEKKKTMGVIWNGDVALSNFEEVLQEYYSIAEEILQNNNTKEKN